MKLLQLPEKFLSAAQAADWLAPLCIRLYLAPVFWMAGWNKYMAFGDTVEWFGNSDWGLGLPAPWLMAMLATGAELLGACCLLAGLAVRWACIPLAVTMFVAIATVHWHNGWAAIAEGMGIFSTDRTMMAVERLNEAKEILKQAGVYDRLTEYGSLAILNNGVEFAVTYLIMLLALFYMGAGRYVSLDWWLARASPRLNGLLSANGGMSAGLK